jgi:hypothetical protein
MARRRRPEDAIQRVVFEHLRPRGARGVFAFHLPSSQWWETIPIEAAILKGLVVVAVVPDVVAVKGGRLTSGSAPGSFISSCAPALPAPGFAAADVISDIA